MKSNFWQKLEKPFFCLAPMYDITDAAFRKIICKYGKPDVFFTEFISSDALCDKTGRKNLKHILKYSKKEKPIVAQLFGATPQNFTEAARYIIKLGFNGIDINMGCPEKTIVKAGQCSALIQYPKLAQEIIKATKKGAGKIPVSVKTRIGFNKNEIETWIPLLLDAQPDALTIHGRTRKEMSKVPCDWNAIKRVVEIRDKMKSKTLIIGNGDVVSLNQGKEYAKKYKVDGVMIGRGVFGNPWFFSKSEIIPLKDHKIKVLLEHTFLFEKTFKKNRNFQIMKKHFKAYINGWSGAKFLRVKLMEAKNVQDVENILKKCNNKL